MTQKITNTSILDGVAVFVAVINAGSFTSAARTLGHSTSYVSKAITRLEKRLGFLEVEQIPAGARSDWTRLGDGPGQLGQPGRCDG